MTILPLVRWYCPRCTTVAQTGTVPNRFHACPGFGGLTTPMLREGTKAKLEAKLREDYIGSEIVQTDGNGRPVMSIVTTRDDGQDVTVFAPTAVLRGDGHGLVD